MPSIPFHQSSLTIISVQHFCQLLSAESRVHLVTLRSISKLSISDLSISSFFIFDLSIHLLFCHGSIGQAILPLQKIGTLPDNEKRYLTKIFLSDLALYISNFLCLSFSENTYIKKASAYMFWILCGGWVVAKSGNWSGLGRGGCNTRGLDCNVGGASI